MKKFVILIALAVLLAALSVIPAQAGPLPGAIFTTLVDGTTVNSNIYESKNDVYLDGGPGPNAPVGAASLPDGDYYFQVTDPSGKTLLSTDKVKYRRFTVSGGVIVSAYNHATGSDIDHGGLTVQLMPYSNTPNNGGVYKVWVTRVDQFVGDPNKKAGTEGFFGFIPSWSKTDNFKVKGRVTPPTISVKKFYDANANGIWDTGEPELPGWLVDVTDPLGSGNTYSTPFDLIASTGVWSFTEWMPASGNWTQTALIVDGVSQTTSATANLNVAGNNGETHTIAFGNVCVGYANNITKGGWHNQVYAYLITNDDKAYINSLPPYTNPTDYWQTPFDGVWTPSNSNGFFGETSSTMEISDYLTASVSVDPYRFQLGQQLLAFILNARHNLGGTDAVIQLPNGNWASVSSIIDDAIASWQAGSGDWIGILDTLNNSDAVPFVHSEPCDYTF